MHFLSECNWCELTSADCPGRVDPDGGMVRFSPHELPAVVLEQRLCELRSKPCKTISVGDYNTELISLV